MYADGQNLHSLLKVQLSLCRPGLLHQSLHGKNLRVCIFLLMSPRASGHWLNFEQLIQATFAFTST